jgi:16S rRNA (guanine527-N7)-methyltransferase
MKGSSALTELETHRTELRKLGGRNAEIIQCGAGVVDEPATVIVVRKDQGAALGGGSRATDKGRR